MELKCADYGRLRRAIYNMPMNGTDDERTNCERTNHERGVIKTESKLCFDVMLMIGKFLPLHEYHLSSNNQILLP